MMIVMLVMMIGSDEHGHGNGDRDDDTSVMRW